MPKKKPKPARHTPGPIHDWQPTCLGRDFAVCAFCGVLRRDPKPFYFVPNPKGRGVLGSYTTEPACPPWVFQSAKAARAALARAIPGTGRRGG